MSPTEIPGIPDIMFSVSVSYEAVAVNPALRNNDLQARSKDDIVYLYK